MNTHSLHPYTPPGELRRLVERLLNGESLSKTESARLEELIEDDQALAYFVHAMQQDSLMPEALSGMPEAPATKPNSVRWTRINRGLIQAAAACLIFGVGWHIGGRPGTSVTPPTFTSTHNAPRITGMVGVEWESGQEPDLLDSGSASKRLAFRSGLAELTYGNGVRVTLQGPADFSITGPNAASLAHGRLVAEVPKGAEGFTVDYEGGSVVDLGTEFGLDVAYNGKAEVGVFDGEVELHRPNETTLSLLANQALLLSPSNESTKAVSIPLDRNKFVRRIPTRNFRWEVDSTEPVEVEFDVSHLVWRDSEYRAIFKWMQGDDGVSISNVALFLNGEPVSSSTSTGATGGLARVRDNLFNLPVTKDLYQRGQWTLKATFQPLPLAPDRDLKLMPISCIGTLLFEEGLVTEATIEDFVGSWSYTHDGKKYQRHFYSDGTMNMTSDGVLYPVESSPFRGSRWWVDAGVLHLSIPGIGLEEEHVLRDRDTMVFVKNPYENARRVENDVE